METYQTYNAAYDLLMDQGDCTKSQQARLAIALYGMVQTGNDHYEIDDLRNYRNAAKRGLRYLAKHNLDLTPSNSELAELEEMK